ncbi:transposase [Effusibacillus lacus]|uniref:Transposase n=3 Tax=Effusibacillus lacus TaxID=1348429 RepID=A0A292YNR6_9BACL|nr:transposase [Effusibacillus lacus]
MPDFRVVEITHPLSTLTEVEIKSRAKEAVIQIIEIITGRKAELAMEDHNYTVQNVSRPTTMDHPSNNIAMESIENGSCDDG